MVRRTGEVARTPTGDGTALMEAARIHHQPNRSMENVSTGCVADIGIALSPDGVSNSGETSRLSAGFWRHSPRLKGSTTITVQHLPGFWNQRIASMGNSNLHRLKKTTFTKF